MHMLNISGFSYKDVKQNLSFKEILNVNIISCLILICYCKIRNIRSCCVIIYDHMLCCTFVLYKQMVGGEDIYINGNLSYVYHCEYFKKKPINFTLACRRLPPSSLGLSKCQKTNVHQHIIVIKNTHNTLHTNTNIHIITEPWVIT